MITDQAIINALHGHGERAYLCTWPDGAQRRIWADNKRCARRIAREWAVRFARSAAEDADPIDITGESR